MRTLTPFAKAILTACAAAAVSCVAAAQQNASFLDRYQARVSATQADQPHWVTPLVTVTPRLEQEVRADFVRQTNAALFNTWNFDNGKGLEIIPARHIELLFNLPPFFAHQDARVRDGFGDVTFNSKYRFFSRNEEHGNAIVTAFLAGSVPTGKNGNGSCCATVTPTLAVGKGFGLFAFTSTAGGSLPASHAKRLGHTVAWNSVVQYRLARKGFARLFWPEAEINSNFYLGGANDGKTQVFATPGLLVGRIPLAHTVEGKRRPGLTLGAGDQIALTRFHNYNHAVVVTVRIPF